MKNCDWDSTLFPIWSGLIVNLSFLQEQSSWHWRNRLLISRRMLLWWCSPFLSSNALKASSFGAPPDRNTLNVESKTRPRSSPVLVQRTFIYKSRRPSLIDGKLPLYQPKDLLLPRRPPGRGLQDSCQLQRHRHLSHSSRLLYSFLISYLSHHPTRLGDVFTRPSQLSGLNTHIQ